MGSGMEGRTFLSGRFIERVHKRPYLTIILVWLLVYVPAAVLIDHLLPDRTRTYLIDGADITSTYDDTTIYMKEDRGLVLMMNLTQGSERLEVQVEDGYVPLGLRVAGSGKLYTPDDYDPRRTWKLGAEKLGYIEGSDNITFSVDVAPEGMSTVYHRDLGNSILEGKTVYRDVPTHEPPLGNVVWVIPCLLGGSFIAFRLYLGAVVLLSALVLMFSWREEGKFRMVAVGGLVLLNPLSVHSSLFAVQNSAVLLLVVSLALTLYRKRMRFLSAAVAGLGMSTGVFSALMVPGFMADRDPMVYRISRTFLALLIGMAPVLVIRTFEPEGIDHFLRYLVAGDGWDRLEGISLWRFLSDVGLPSFLVLPLLLCLSVLIIIMTVRRGKLGPFVTGPLMIMLFLALYPVVPAGSYLLLLAFIPFYWELRSLMKLTLVLCTMAVATDIFVITELGGGYLVFGPILLSMTMLCIVVFLMVKVYTSRTVYERAIEEPKRQPPFISPSDRRSF